MRGRKMRGKFKRKPRPTTLLLTTGFVVSLTSILLGISSVNLLISASRMAARYTFTSQARICVTDTSSKSWDLSALFADIKGLALTEGVLMYLDAFDHGSYSWTILLSANGDSLKYPLKWGRLPKVDNNEIAIPDTAEPYLQQKGEQHSLEVQGRPYQVTGVFDTVQAGSQSPFVMGYLSLPDEIAETLLSETSFQFSLSSDLVNVFQQAETLKTNLAKQSSSAFVSISRLQTEAPVYLTVENTGLSLCLAIYLFAVANCMVITNYWMITRRRDMSIQKAFGWSNCRLILSVVAKIAGILAKSFVLSAMLLGLAAT